MVCDFWTLPMEIRWMIYGFAFGCHREIRPQMVTTLLELKFGRHGQTSAVRIPQNQTGLSTVTDKRMVNKQFLAETVQHLAESNQFHLDISTYASPDHSSSSFRDHVRVLIVDPYPAMYKTLDQPAQYPHLRHLELRIRHDFISDKTRSPVYSALDGAAIVEAFSLWRGLETVSVVNTCGRLWERARCTTYKEQHKLAIRNIEKILQEMVTRPKEIEDVGKSKPLTQARPTKTPTKRKGKKKIKPSRVS